MGVAIAKTETGLAAAPRTSAYQVLDVLPDQLTFRVNVTDELLGALVRSRATHFTVSIVGEDIRRSIAEVTK
jgi:hypothetical protein